MNILRKTGIIIFFLAFTRIVWGGNNAALPFSSGQLVVVNDIAIHGNKTTKEEIIARELTFSKHDTIKKNELGKILQKTKQNLLNTSLFNFVSINEYPAPDSTHLIIEIELIERWYTWPFPLFENAETNFNTWWKKKDFSRTNYGFYIVHENFRGRKETLRLKVRLGYSEQYALQYLIPYLNRKKTIGLGFTAGYSRNHEITYKTIGNDRIFYHDPKEYVRKEFYSRITYTHRQKIYNTHTFELQYSNSSIQDSITTLTDEYFKRNTANTRFLSLSWYFQRDKRDLAAYPLKGYYLKTELKKHGLGVVNKEQLNLLYTSLDFNQYWHLYKRLYLANGLKIKASLLDDPPYYLQRGLGYNDFVRGYEYYVIDGQNFALAKTNLKFQLVKPQTGKFNFIKTERFNTYHYAFYLNLFFDAGYVYDQLYTEQNYLENTLQFGTGIGLDFVTYYDQVLRMEYSFNKLGESGFFLHFTKSI